MWKSSFIGYKYAKYFIFEKKFSQYVWFPSTIIVDNLPESKSFHNLQKYPQTMSVRLPLSPCLPQTFISWWVRLTKTQSDNKIEECSFFCLIKLANLGALISYRHSFHELVGWHAEFQGLPT